MTLMEESFQEEILNIKDEGQRKKMERERENILKPKYFCITFGPIEKSSRLRFLSCKSFVYRGDTTLRDLELENQLKIWFPKAVFLRPDLKAKETSRKQSLLLDVFQIQIRKVEAVFNKGSEFDGKKVPLQVLEYPRNNATNVFVHKKMFEKQRNKDNPNASSYARNTLFVTKFPLPGMLRWSQVIQEVSNIETTPIQNTLSMLQNKNWDLELTLVKLRSDPKIQKILGMMIKMSLAQALQRERIEQKSLGLQSVGQSLKGVVVPEVGGGIPKIEEAFINDEYDKSHPEDKDYVDALKDEIRKQVSIIEELLPIHDKLKSDALQQFQEVLQDEFNKTKKEIEKKWGLKLEKEGFRENVLTEIFMREVPENLKALGQR